MCALCGAAPFAPSLRSNFSRPERPAGHQRGGDGPTRTQHRCLHTFFYVPKGKRDRCIPILQTSGDLPPVRCRSGPLSFPPLGERFRHFVLSRLRTRAARLGPQRAASTPDLYPGAAWSAAQQAAARNAALQLRAFQAMANDSPEAMALAFAAATKCAAARAPRRALRWGG